MVEQEVEEVPETCSSVLCWLKEACSLCCSVDHGNGVGWLFILLFSGALLMCKNIKGHFNCAWELCRGSNKALLLWGSLSGHFTVWRALLLCWGHYYFVWTHSRHCYCVESLREYFLLYGGTVTVLGQYYFVQTQSSHCNCLEALMGNHYCVGHKERHYYCVGKKKGHNYCVEHYYYLSVWHNFLGIIWIMKAQYWSKQ